MADREIEELEEEYTDLARQYLEVYKENQKILPQSGASEKELAQFWEQTKAERELRERMDEIRRRNNGN